MEAKAAIAAILKAKKIEDILDISNVKSEFDRLIKLVHPDRCSLPQAHDASSKLITLRDAFEKGTRYTDDIGQYHTNGYFAEFSGDKDFLKRSLANYKHLKSLKDTTSLHFHRYYSYSASTAVLSRLIFIIWLHLFWWCWCLFLSISKKSIGIGLCSWLFLLFLPKPMKTWNLIFCLLKIRIG